MAARVMSHTERKRVACCRGSRHGPFVSRSGDANANVTLGRRNGLKFGRTAMAVPNGWVYSQQSFPETRRRCQAGKRWRALVLLFSSFFSFPRLHGAVMTRSGVLNGDQCLVHLPCFSAQPGHAENHRMIGDKGAPLVESSMPACVVSRLHHRLCRGRTWFRAVSAGLLIAPRTRRGDNAATHIS